MNDPLWYVIIQAVAAVSTTFGVLAALYVAIIREPRKAAEERKHRQAEMDSLNRAEAERFAAQARKVVPSCLRTPMFGSTWWTVKVENLSNAVATIRTVNVTALDVAGNVVPDGCHRANNTMPVDEAFERSVQAALSGALAGGLQQSGYGRLIPQGTSNHLAQQLSPTVKKAMQDAMVGHFSAEWRNTLGPNQSALMAYTTTDPNFKLRIMLEYEDEAGYQWRRTDSGQPQRLNQDGVNG